MEMQAHGGFHSLALFIPVLMAAGAAGARSDAGAGPDAYASLVQQAQDDLSRRDTLSALAALDQAVRLRPEAGEALSLLGRTYLGLERYAQAAAALRRAVVIADRTPGQIEARIVNRTDLAVALAREERSDEAIAALREVLEIAPDRPTIHHDIGRIDMAIGGDEKAVAEFRKEIEIQGARPGDPDPAFGMSFEGLGIAAYRLGDDATALAAFEKRSGAPGAADSIEGRFHYGLVLARLGRHAEAAASFREVLRREPDNRGALQGLARSDVSLGLEEERRSSLARFEELYRQEEEAKSKRVRIRDLRAEALRRADAGDAKGAVSSLTEAARLSPGDAGLQIELARYLARSGDGAGSLERLRRILESAPLNAEAQFQLGRELAESGDPSAALSALQRAAQIEPMALNYRTALAQTYLRLGRNDDGVRELRLARSLDPDNPEAAFNLGLGLAQAGSLRDAASELESAIGMGYREPVIHQVLSQVYTALGDEQRALREKDIFEGRTGAERPRP